MTEIIDEAKSNTVFVGNLSFDATGEQLNDHINQLGFSCTTSLFSYGVNGRSKGCALAEFDSQESAEAAITAISASTMGDRELFARADKGRVAKSRPITEPAPPTYVYVGNLSEDVVEADLEEVFSGFGEIVYLNVLKDGRSGKCRGSGVVQFSEEESASSAMAEKNGATLLDQEMVVEPLKSLPRAHSSKRETKKKPSRRRKKAVDDGEAPLVEKELPTSGLNIFVGNLSWDVNEEKLEEVFAPYGEVVSVSMSRTKDPTRHRGWATVKYSDPSQSEAAIAGMHGKEVDGRELTVELKAKKKKSSAPKKERTALPPREKKERPVVENPGCHLYVGNLDWKTDEEDLTTLFSKIGIVSEATITRSRSKANPRSRGWGTVEMGSVDEANSAIESLNDTDFTGRQLVVRLDEKLNDTEEVISEGY